MKEVTVSSLGFDLKKLVPETVEEYDSLARRVGACLDDAVNSTLYRGTFAEFRDLFLMGREADGETPAFIGVEGLSGVKRLTKTEKRGEKEVEVYAETEGAYWKRVIATNFGGDEEKAVLEFQSVAQAAMELAAFDPSVKERAPAGPKSIAKRYTEIATQAVKDGKGQKLADMLGSVLARTIALTGEQDKDIATLARAIADNEARKRKESEKEYAV